MKSLYEEENLGVLRRTSTVHFMVAAQLPRYRSSIISPSWAFAWRTSARTQLTSLHQSQSANSMQRYGQCSVKKPKRKAQPEVKHEVKEESTWKSLRLKTPERCGLCCCPFVVPLDPIFKDSPTPPQPWQCEVRASEQHISMTSKSMPGWSSSASCSENILNRANPLSLT